MANYTQVDTRFGAVGKQGVLMVGRPTATRLGFLLFNSEGEESNDPTLPAAGTGVWLNSSGALMARTLIIGGTFIGPATPTDGFCIGDGVNMGGGNVSLADYAHVVNLTTYGLAPAKGEPAVDTSLNTITLAAKEHDKPGLLVLAGPSTRYAYLWVDSTGDLRINGTKPADQDADGMVVGAQDSVTDYGATIFATTNADGLDDTDNVELTVLGDTDNINITAVVCKIQREVSAVVFETYDAGGVLHRYFVWSFGGLPDLRIVEDTPSDVIADGVLVSAQS
jgi:hypothetical protein